jgi:anthranilate synthase component 1
MQLFPVLELDEKFKQINRVQQDLDYDSLTPIMVYAAVGGPGNVMMESAYDEGYGKSSFIGINPLASFRASANRISISFDNLEHLELGDPYAVLAKFTHGRRAFGFISYDAVRLKEKLPDRHPSTGMADFYFQLYKTIINFNHQAQKVTIYHEGSNDELEAIIAKLYTQPRPNLNPPTGFKELKPDISDAEFILKVKQAQEYIRRGDIFQVVLSRTFSADLALEPFALYRALRQLNPTPYLFLFEEPDFALIGASPELLVGIKDGVIETVPIAGTCKKDDDIQQLLVDPKETAEHVMLVDLARNDVGSVAKAGSVKVNTFKKVKTYSYVSHIVSQVLGQMDLACNPLKVLQAILPAGTLSGAPKIRAMEIIDELEVSRRGIYGGAVVIIDEQGNLTSAITIRTLVKQGKRVELRTGAGIVYDSIPEKEVAETYLKAYGAMASIAQALGVAHPDKDVL